MTSPYIYVPDVPQGNQQINNTTTPIEGNFEYIAQLMAVNHVGFNTTNTFGNHTIINYMQQTSDPSTGPTEIALYSKAVNDINGIELFYRYPNNGVVNQLTGLGENSGGTGTGGGYFNINSTSYSNSLPNGGFGYMYGGYWQYLSNGILIITGYLNNYYPTTKPSSPYTITIPSGITDVNGVVIPSFTQIPFNVQLAAYTAQYGTNCNFAINPTSTTTAQCYFSGNFNNPPTTIVTPTVTFIGI